jgi:hypothetical protein
MPEDISKEIDSYLIIKRLIFFIRLESFFCYRKKEIMPSAFQQS